MQLGGSKLLIRLLLVLVQTRLLQTHQLFIVLFVQDMCQLSWSQLLFVPLLVLVQIFLWEARSHSMSHRTCGEINRWDSAE